MYTYTYKHALMNVGGHRWGGKCGCMEVAAVGEEAGIFTFRALGV